VLRGGAPDEGYGIRGCWVEQPAALQAFWLPALTRGEAAAEAGVLAPDTG
jgi:hypothetical protein